MPQHWTFLSFVTTHACRSPVARDVAPVMAGFAKAPFGGAHSPVPQQTTPPFLSSAHPCVKPAATWLKVPEGGTPIVAASAPQHVIAVAVRAQAIAPLATSSSAPSTPATSVGFACSFGAPSLAMRPVPQHLIFLSEPS